MDPPQDSPKGVSRLRSDRIRAPVPGLSRRRPEDRVSRPARPNRKPVGGTHPDRPRIRAAPKQAGPSPIEGPPVPGIPGAGRRPPGRHPEPGFPCPGRGWGGRSGSGSRPVPARAVGRGEAALPADRGAGTLSPLPRHRSRGEGRPPRAASPGRARCDGADRAGKRAPATTGEAERPHRHPGGCGTAVRMAVVVVLAAGGRCTGGAVRRGAGARGCRPGGEGRPTVRCSAGGQPTGSATASRSRSASSSQVRTAVLCSPRAGGGR